MRIYVIASEDLDQEESGWSYGLSSKLGTRQSEIEMETCSVGSCFPPLQGA
jgi:hypothetical protein